MGHDRAQGPDLSPYPWVEMLFILVDPILFETRFLFRVLFTGIADTQRKAVTLAFL
jgi:hypothetical protein